MDWFLRTVRMREIDFECWLFFTLDIFWLKIIWFILYHLHTNPKYLIKGLILGSDNGPYFLFLLNFWKKSESNIYHDFNRLQFSHFHTLFGFFVLLNYLSSKRFVKKTHFSLWFRMLWNLFIWSWFSNALVLWAAHNMVSRKRNSEFSLKFVWNQLI